jgi:glycosyltransferase involved in cell wall biosynthesis
MLRRVAEKARAVVVHNPAAARAVTRHAPDARVVEIPHLFAMPEVPGGAEVLRFRQRLGVKPGAFLFGVFGYLRESKRLAAVLDAFSAVERELPHAGLLVAGQFASTDLERAVAPLLSRSGVVRLPYLPEREFWLAAGAVDACVNLRYPSTGETSGISIRLMGIGKPVMMTDAPECSGFPEDACVRIEPGAAERDSLRQHMILLASMSEVARAIGQRGARHIEAHHRVQEVSKKYWKLLCEPLAGV